MRYAAWISILGFAGASCALYACGDKESEPVGLSGTGGTGSGSSSGAGGGNGSSTSGSGTGSEASSTSGSGSASGSGSGSSSASSSTSASSSASSSASGSSSSSGGGPVTVNGCDPATAEDHTNQTTVDIAFGGALGNAYSPKCIKIKANTKVNFNGTFLYHPLDAGEYKNGAIVPAQGSPIKSTNTNTTVQFTFPDAGTFPYYCTYHYDFSGMYGAIFVE